MLRCEAGVIVGRFEGGRGGRGPPYGGRGGPPPGLHSGDASGRYAPPSEHGAPLLFCLCPMTKSSLSLPLQIDLLQVWFLQPCVAGWQLYSCVSLVLYLVSSQIETLRGAIHQGAPHLQGCGWIRSTHPCVSHLFCILIGSQTAGNRLYAFFASPSTSLWTGFVMGAGRGRSASYSPDDGLPPKRRRSPGG